MPQSLTPLIIKGRTVVFNLISEAFPQAATIPESFVWASTFARIFPPTVSTAQSHNPLSNVLGSFSNSLLKIMFLAPIYFIYSLCSCFLVTAVTL